VNVGLAIVLLHQRERRARDGDLGGNAEPTRDGAREERLASAEVAGERDEIAGAKAVGDLHSEARGVAPTA
jgi:hypothetical protein